MTYSEKLQHPLWQRKRLEILNRDNFTCQWCGDNETTLHIHHNYYSYDKQPWEYPNESLKSLCKHCHLIAESLKEYLEYWDIESVRRINSTDKSSDKLYIAILIKEGSKLKSIFVFEYLSKIDILTLKFDTNSDIIEHINDSLNG